MKRVIAVLLIAAMSLSLCACGEVPADMDRKTYKYGKEALTVMDDYLSGEINGTEACEKLDEIKQNLEVLDAYLQKKIEKEEEKFLGGKVGGSLDKVKDALKIKSTNSIVEFAITLFCDSINGTGNDSEKKQACQNMRNYLGAILAV